MKTYSEEDNVHLGCFGISFIVILAVIYGCIFYMAGYNAGKDNGEARAYKWFLEHNIEAQEAVSDKL